MTAEWEKRGWERDGRERKRETNERETEGPHDCTNSNTNTAATTATQISVVKWLIMITTDNLMAALI